jgi:hypothetical protein
MGTGLKPVAILFCLGLAACSAWDSPYLTTLAKLKYLQATMPHLCEFVTHGDLAFPQTGAEIAEFLNAAGEGNSDPLYNPRQDPLVDGWGQEMRVTGDPNAYRIRSAGPDGIFHSQDDIYLVGSPTGEQIVDGVKEQNLTGRNLLQEGFTSSFQEPTGYYRISLPGSYSVSRHYDGPCSEFTFSYSSLNQVKILARPVAPGWEPAAARDARVAAITNQIDPDFVDFRVAHAQLIELQGAPGYELEIWRENQRAHLWEIVTADQHSLIITVLTGGEDHHFLLARLVQAVEQNLELP